VYLQVKGVLKLKEKNPHQVFGSVAGERIVIFEFSFPFYSIYLFVPHPPPNLTI